MADVSRVISAEVFDSSIAYDEYTDEKTGITHPRGVIMISYLSGKQRTVAFAYPLNATSFSIPITGEQVTCVKLLGMNDGPFTRLKQFYYIQSVNVFDSLSSNRFLGINSIGPAAGKPFSREAIKYKNSLDNVQSLDSAKLQPYVGDTILQSRYSGAIRFSSSNTKASAIYEVPTPPWKGDSPTSPILAITNGLQTDKETYIVEDPEKDNALIYLTSDQSINILSSQTNLGRRVDRSNIFKDPQIILSSDRVLINAKEEQVILSGKESVTIATPNWAMNMNEFFNAFEDFVLEVEKTATAQSPYGTGVGPTTPNPGLTAGIAKIKSVLVRMRQ